VLFDERKKALCVIDLDTVMPGYVHYDFGDAVRTFTNRAKEDETNLANVSIDIEIFKGLASGFLSEAGTILTQVEISNLVYGAGYIVFEQTIRFLTDYLNGDTYYKTNYTDHNLVRAKAQFRLLQSIEEQFSEMENIIRKEAGSSL
jgi:hypothetical protein